MTIDPNRVGVVLGKERVSWTARDVMLYTLGVGAGVDDLRFTTDNSHGVEQQVLPTYAVIIGTLRGTDLRKAVGDFDPSKAVLGAQAFRLHRSIPVEGTGEVTARISGIQDKGPGKHAIIEVESEVVDVETKEILVTTLFSGVIRGAGGFGGDRGPPAAPAEVPERSPDHEINYTTREDQALIYRLSGDYNPVHSDPWFARERAGFPRPILQGLCTYGFAGRALVQALCTDDNAGFGAMEARFSLPVFPGETLTTRIWETTDGALFQTLANPGGRVVIAGGRFERPERSFQ